MLETCRMVAGNDDSFASWLNDGAHSSVVIVLVNERLPSTVFLRLDEPRVAEVSEVHSDVVNGNERRQLTHAVHRQLTALSAGRHQFTSCHLVIAADCQ